MQGLDLTAGPAHCPRSAWPPCCCSSSQDNAGNCVNALSSEGVEQGNSGQEGLMGGLLSALMCITALLAGNRSVGETMVKWFQVPTRGHTDQRSWSDNRKIIDDQVSFSTAEGESAGPAGTMCVFVCSGGILMQMLSSDFSGPFRGTLHPAGETKGIGSLIPEILWMIKPFLVLCISTETVLVIPKRFHDI